MPFTPGIQIQPAPAVTKVELFDGATKIRDVDLSEITLYSSGVCLDTEDPDRPPQADVEVFSDAFNATAEADDLISTMPEIADNWNGLVDLDNFAFFNMFYALVRTICKKK